tara:strand:- start:438 stop:956 length:519 start_codon:yes stop_codon:yes gene_type:complete
MARADDRAARLNQRALRAAKGFEVEPEEALAALLRSEVPIEHNTRMAIADLFDRCDGVQAKIVGNASAKRHIVKLLALQEKLRIGRELKRLIAGGFTREHAKEALKGMSGTPRGASPSYADKAIIYADRVDAWLELSVQAPVWPREKVAQKQEQLELMFHRMEAMGSPLDRR